jgi:hypothetical protein
MCDSHRDSSKTIARTYVLIGSLVASRELFSCVYIQGCNVTLHCALKLNTLFVHSSYTVPSVKLFELRMDDVSWPVKPSIVLAPMKCQDRTSEVATSLLETENV